MFVIRVLHIYPVTNVEIVYYVYESCKIMTDIVSKDIHKIRIKIKNIEHS